METLILISCLICGIIIRVLLKRNSAIKSKNVFNWQLSLNAGLLSLITGIVLILIRDDLINIFPITKLTAVVIGYTGDSVFRNLMKQVQKK